MLLRDYLQQYHGISRRKITDAINQGMVFVNNQKIENYKSEIQEKDFLTIKSFHINEQISFSADNNFEKILIFNKPIGYTCSKSDPYNRTFYELLPKEFLNKYYYIGRLDKNSRGLMILTTDSKLVHEFEHPSKEIEKVYIIRLNKDFDWKLKEKILGGIYDDGEHLRTKSLEKGNNGSIRITLNEGKKRHIRRIFKSLGYQVIDLQRVAIGNYKLGNLKEGEFQTI